MATCLTPPEVLTASTISGGNSECISCGTLSSCSFQRIFRFLTLSLFRIVSFCCQAVRLVLPPSVSQSAAESGATAMRIAAQTFSVVILQATERPFYCVIALLFQVCVDGVFFLRLFLLCQPLIL